MEVFFETASIFCTVRGKEISKKSNKEVARVSKVSLTSDIYDKIGTDKNQEAIPEKISKRFQSLQITTIETVKDKNITFKHFSILFIYREQQNYKVTKLKDKPRTITIGKDEFPCVELFVTVHPIDGTLIVDRRANLTPLAYFFRLKLQNILKPQDYLLSDKQELFDSIKVAIHQNLEKNYREILQSKFNNMKKLSITLAKPISVQKQSLIDSKKNKQGLNLVKNTIKSILGQSAARSKFLDLPIKNMQISLTLDENLSLENIRKSAKTNLLDFIDNELVTASFVEFDSESDGNSIERAVLSGLRVTEELEISVSDSEKGSFMWLKQRELYFSQSEEED